MPPSHTTTTQAMRKGLKTQHGVDAAATTLRAAASSEDGKGEEEEEQGVPPPQRRGDCKFKGKPQVTQPALLLPDCHNTAKRERQKNTCTVSSRLRHVVEQMLTCDPEQYALAMQETTIFAFKTQQSELVLSFLQEMRRENGTLYQNKEALLQLISEAYDKTQSLLVV